MRIISLTGEHNTGKSTTLNLVYDSLLKIGATPTEKEILGNRVNRDFHTIVTWKKLQIAFYTMGDYSIYLAAAIYYYAGQDVDLLICASSTSTPMVRANAALDLNSTTRIPKSITDNIALQATYNSNDATMLLEMI